MNFHNLLEKIDEIREKITDNEYKKIVDELMRLNNITPDNELYVLTYNACYYTEPVSEIVWSGVKKKVIRLSQQQRELIDKPGQALTNISTIIDKIPNLYFELDYTNEYDREREVEMMLDTILILSLKEFKPELID